MNKKQKGATVKKHLVYRFEVTTDPTADDAEGQKAIEDAIKGVGGVVSVEVQSFVTRVVK